MCVCVCVCVGMFGISKCIGVRRDVYQELGQLVQRRCTKSINSRVNTLKFRGALGVVLMLHHGNSEGLGSHQDFGGWATSGFEDFVVP